MIIDDTLIFESFSKACHDLQNPKLKTSAEASIQNISSKSHALALFEAFLERTDSPMVQFYSLRAIQGSVGREYGWYEITDMKMFRHNLIAFALHNQSLQHYVRDCLLRTIALLTKRMLLDGGTDEGQETLGLYFGFMQGDEKQRFMGIQFVSSLLAEISLNDRSSTLKLSMENHLKIKRFFTDQCLIQIWSGVLNCLNITIDAEMDAQLQVAILSNLMECAERVLDWDFEITRDGATRPSSAVAQISNVQIEDTEETVFPFSWREALGVRVVELLFRSAGKLFHFSPSCNGSIVSRHCILRLGGLCGPIFQNDSEHNEYNNTFLRCVNDLLSNFTAHSSVSIDLMPAKLSLASAMVNFVETNHSPSNSSLWWHSQQFWDSCEMMFLLTIRSLESVASQVEQDEEKTGYDWDVITEAFRFWSLIVKVCRTVGFKDERCSVLIHIAEKLASAYVETRVIVATLALDVDDSEDVDLDIEEEDRNDEQRTLEAFGVIGQYCAERATSVMADAIRSSIRDYRVLEQQPASATQSDQAPTRLHERTHWLLTLTGYLVCDDNSGTFIMAESMFTLSEALFQLLDIFQLRSGLLMSPQVVQTFWWCLGKWSRILQCSEYSRLQSPKELASLAEMIVCRMEQLCPVWVSETRLVHDLLETFNLLGSYPSFADAINSSSISNHDLNVVEECAAAQQRGKDVLLWCRSSEDLRSGIFHLIHQELQDQLQLVTKFVNSSKLEDPQAATSLADLFNLLSGVASEMSSNCFGDLVHMLFDPLRSVEGLTIAFRQDGNLRIALLSFVESFCKSMSKYPFPQEFQSAIDRALSCNLRALFEDKYESSADRTKADTEHELLLLSIQALKAYAKALTQRRFVANGQVNGNGAADINLVPLFQGLTAILILMSDNKSSVLSSSSQMDPEISQDVSELLLILTQNEALALVNHPDLFTNCLEVICSNVNSVSYITSRNMLGCAESIGRVAHSGGGSQLLLREAVEKLLAKVLSVLVFEKTDRDLFDAFAETLLSLIIVCAEGFESVVSEVSSPLADVPSSQKKIASLCQYLKASTPLVFPSNDEEIESLITRFTGDLSNVLGQCRTIVRIF